MAPNILVILPFNDKSPVTTRPEPETLTPESVQPTKVENESVISINLLKDTYDTEDALEKGVLVKLPERIGRTLSAFFDRDAMYEIYGVMLC